MHGNTLSVEDCLFVLVHPRMWIMYEAEIKSHTGGHGASDIKKWRRQCADSSKTIFSLHLPSCACSCYWKVSQLPNRGKFENIGNTPGLLKSEAFGQNTSRPSGANMSSTPLPKKSDTNLLTGQTAPNIPLRCLSISSLFQVALWVSSSIHSLP